MESSSRATSPLLPPLARPLPGNLTPVPSSSVFKGQSALGYPAQIDIQYVEPEHKL